jgi:hypothetical protein
LAHDDDDDAELLRQLLNGRRPRYRRERPSGERHYTVVTDPSLLDPYERLFYDEDPNRTKEALTVCAFYWAEQFTYDEAAAWFAVGAGYNDFHWCVSFKRCGVPPDVTGRSLTRRGVDAGVTIFGAVRTHVVTPEDVRDMIDRQRRRDESA